MCEHPKEDLFNKACQYLEKISELKEKELLNDSEYKDIKTDILLQMKQATVSRTNDFEEPISPTQEKNRYTLSISQLHRKIVRRISATYESSGNDDKQRMLRAIGEMADGRVLNPGDSPHIEKTVNVAYSPLYTTEDENFSDKVIETLATLNEINNKVKTDPNCSIAAKTITEITQESSNEATKEIQKDLANNTKKQLWKKLVIEDLRGALEGGAAIGGIIADFGLNLPLATAVTGIFPALGSNLSLAALAIVIGAGIKSGTAYGEKILEKS